MSDNGNNHLTSEAQPSVHVVLYHPTGARLSFHFPFTYEQTEGDVGAWVIGAVNTLIASGLSVEPPENLGDRMDVSHVVRGIKLEDDGRETDRIYLYAPWGKPEYGSQMTVYLNTPEDRATFESASGVKTASLNVWDAKAPPTRGSNLFDQFAHAVQFAVLRKKSRELKEGESAKDVPWALVRYIGAPAPKTALDELKASELPTAGNGETEAPKPSGKNVRWTRIMAAAAKMPHYKSRPGDNSHAAKTYELLVKHEVFAGDAPADTVIGYLSGYGMLRDKGMEQDAAIEQLKRNVPF